MRADDFWNVIGIYNQQTWIVQVLLMVVITTGLILSHQVRLQWLPKVLLGIANLYIGIVFFLIFGTEPIQHYFAAPLFCTIGVLFLWEGVKHRQDALSPLKRMHWFFLFLILMYPVISVILGNSYPKMVVYLMPCPLISLSIVVYSRYTRKNIVLLILLALWGLTGVKSFFFNVYEDIILLLSGIYCVWILVTELKNKYRNRKPKIN